MNTWDDVLKAQRMALGYNNPPPEAVSPRAEAPQQETVREALARLIFAQKYRCDLKTAKRWMEGAYPTSHGVKEVWVLADAILSQFSVAPRNQEK
jgi:hypothetical protein